MLQDKQLAGRSGGKTEPSRFRPFQRGDAPKDQSGQHFQPLDVGRGGWHPSTTVKGYPIVQKTCSQCKAPYWTRWRNEPVSLCPDCRAAAVICPTCAKMLRPPPDPDQGEIFPRIVWRPLSRVESPTIEERYWSLRAKASQATRRRYPFC
jgi:hypothetical protein